MNRLRNHAIVFALLLSGVFPAAACRAEDAGPPEDPKFIEQTVEEIAVDYGTYGAEAEARIGELLEELSSADPAAGTRWKQITDLWKSPELGQPLHYDVLPDGLPDTDELCIVVLGFQLNPDGTMKEELIGRLTTALESAEKYPNAYIACTGGGTASENESVSEAGEMAAWLMEHGIAKERVIVEDNSLTTAQNAIFTYDMITSLYPSVRKLAIVSSDYHIATGELLFQAEAILRASAPENEKLEVISNAAWKAPAGSLSSMFQAGALIELSGMWRRHLPSITTTMTFIRCRRFIRSISAPAAHKGVSAGKYFFRRKHGRRNQGPLWFMRSSQKFHDCFENVS